MDGSEFVGSDSVMMVGEWCWKGIYIPLYLSFLATAHALSGMSPLLILPAAVVPRSRDNQADSRSLLTLA